MLHMRSIVHRTTTSVSFRFWLVETVSCKTHMLSLQTPLHVSPLKIKAALKSLTNAAPATTFAYVKSARASVVLRLVWARISLRNKAPSFNWGI